MATDEIDWSKYPRHKIGPHGERLEFIRMQMPHETLTTLETAALRAGRDVDAQLTYMLEIVLYGHATDPADPLSREDWMVVFQAITFLPDEDDEDTPRPDQAPMKGSC